jgi:hypothetical protein
MHWAADFAGFRRQSTANRYLLVEAMVWLGLARAALVTMPFRWITRLFALRPGEEETSREGDSRELAGRVGWALRTAAARTPWPSTCLTQALAGSGMLWRRRIPGMMFMGVARASHVPGGIEAHAWLSSAGVILTGSGTHKRFQVVAKFTRGSRWRPLASARR